MPDLGHSLLVVARNTIAAHFGLPTAAPVDDPALQTPGATFVTLTRDGELRGCVGSLEATRTLFEDVREHALAAAFSDPRFLPLSADELPLTRIEVSLLTPAEPIRFTSEADALRQLRPHVDGVILSAQGRRATFLPQVWEQLPEPTAFMARLKQKAGLPADYWGRDVRLERYQVTKWKEAPP